MVIEEVLDRKKYFKVIAYYKLILVDSGFYYFGSTNNLFHRITQHRSNLNCGRHDNIKLSEAYLNSTSKKIHVEYKMFSSIEEANAFEEKMIRENLNDPLMCNIGLNNKFGDVLTLHPNRDELIKQRAKTLSENQSKLTLEEKYKIRDVRGNLNPMWGKTHTPEARKIISLANRGKVGPNLGKPLSEETKKKLSEIGKTWVGPLNPFFGKKHTEESIEKMKLSHKGQEPSVFNKISIDNIEYNSCSDASRKLGILISTISFRVRSKNPKFDNYKLLERVIGKKNN